MLEELDAVPGLQRRLAVHRRTIEFLERQRAQFGAFTPAYIWHQFDDTRSEIAQVKRQLRAFGVVVDDLPGDEEPASDTQPGPRLSDNPALLLTYQRMIVDQLRSLPLAGMSGWPDLSLRLADLYIERSLVPFGQSSASAPAPLVDLVRNGRVRVLLEGEHGSGKTTCLHALALACAARASGEAAAAELVAGWPDPPPLPILLSAHEVAAALSRGNIAPEDQQLPTLSAFWNAVEEWLQYSSLQALVPTIQQLFEHGGCLVLIDGLDDLPAGASQHAFMVALGRFVMRYPDNSFVVTCRSFQAGAMAPLSSFTRYSMPALEQPVADALIARWYALIADRAGLLMPEDVTRRIALLQGALHGDARLGELARTPLALALCILAHAERYTLPSDRGVVLGRLADLLLTGWDHGRLGGAQSLARELSIDALARQAARLTLLAPLGLGFQSRRDQSRDQPAVLNAAEIEALLEQGLASAIGESPEHARTASALLAWASRHGLLAPADRGAYTMPYREVREYLAGRALAALPDFPTRAYGLRGDVHWHEPLLYAMRELGGRAAHIARLLVRLLLHPPSEDQAIPPADVQLAAECLVELGSRSRSDQSLRAEVLLRLRELIESGRASVRERIRAGMLLGQLGDTRFAGPLPPLAQVQAGAFILGTLDGYDDEGPAQWLDLPAFAIGIYPVTNQEYAAFLADQSERPAPRYWHDPRFNNPACPVVGVTWDDAVAYCRWLGQQLAKAGLLPPGQVVRLPLEAEWEKAASWDEQQQAKRRYPWGDDWVSSYANTADGRGEWMTVAVGSYPAGQSPYGLHDCIGNVWEWTASAYVSYPGAAAPFSELSSYTLRGSSCASTPTHARCTYRSRLPASYWRYHLGFRVVVGLPLSDSSATTPR